MQPFPRNPTHNEVAGTRPALAASCDLPDRRRTVTTLSDFSATTLTGQEQPLSEYEGDVVLVVNTASRCGFTPQLAGLERLQETYGARGLRVLGFPCNQFGSQEPGTEDEIGEFCQKNYGVTFPMFAKVDVNGRDAHPVWKWLRSQRGGLIGDKIRWNFTKFLVGRDGRVLGRYAPNTDPASIADDIEKALEA
ncbi:glutathione peroxidase [Terracoccus luteus]|uniref:Glutathione peroxidase n=1 Tax=Terracoccus luteus TaxID=53356 RepID=A0A495XVA8_9MICO|nr:glutathione peroxidase [Terracoccus luteus]